MADNLCFVQSGSIAVYTTFEGNEFIMDIIPPGSIINYRAFFLQDMMYVNMRAIFDTTLLLISNQQVDHFVNQKYSSDIEENRPFSQRTLFAQNKYIKASKGADKYPIDYIIHEPEATDE